MKKKLKKQRTKESFDLEKIPIEAYSLAPPVICKDCGAKKIQYESKGFCCSNEEIMLKPHDVPSELYELFISTSTKTREFKTYRRIYNSNFAFTSLGVKYDKALCGDKGIYIFRV